MAEKHQFPCQKCGAQLSYVPGTSHMSCRHCDHEHEISVNSATINELDYYSAIENLQGYNNVTTTMAVKCTNCAASFEFDKHIHADECPYCGTRIVSELHQSSHIKPKGILPFVVSSKHANQAYKQWLKKLWFAPNKLKKYARKNQSLNGMYIPYWTYDCATTTWYRGQRGTFYQVPMRVRVNINGKVTTQTRMVTKIRWRNVSGAISLNFDDVLIFASNSLPRSMARELEPWDTVALKPYQHEYLSGFRSEVYQTDIKQGFELARTRMHPLIRSAIHHDIGGDQQRITQSESKYSDITFKHILLPFWTAGFRFGKKSYQFIINGRTGEVQGERPYSIWKIAFASIVGIILFIIIISVLNASGYLNFDALMPVVDYYLPSGY